ncbi:hypothetical protein [Pseudoalteromonas sp. T1lg48]|uniref:hypothetical protein n=1 Tax=Pseudoalteromonas sp. T1lg48 TaxID=2077100 RepID=UPI000CF70EFE|nr:hypothetical protein [Pseudoalteromonas sp. T1lg48]
MKYPLIALTALALSGCNSTDNNTATGTAKLQSNSAAVSSAEASKNTVDKAPAQASAQASVQAPQQDQVSEANLAKASKSAHDNEVLYILANVPYSQPHIIADNVKNECYQLGSQFSDSLVKYAKAQRIEIKQVKAELPQTGKVLQLSIDNVYSGGNAFIGHRKSASVSAKLMIDGKVVDSTSKTRNSAGGFLGGFKGSCSVLAHTVNTLGNDIAKWAKSSKHLL